MAVACGAVEAVGVEEGVQGLQGDGDAEGACEEVEGVGVASVGMVAEELGDGAGVAWQEFAIGPPGETAVDRLDDLLGGKSLVAGGGSPSETGESCDLGDFESTVAVEQEVAEEAAAVVIGVLLLSEAEDGVEECVDLRGEPRRREIGLGQPVLEGGSTIAHEGHSVPGSAGDDDTAQYKAPRGKLPKKSLRKRSVIARTAVTQDAGDFPRRRDGQPSDLSLVGVAVSRPRTPSRQH